MSVQISGGSFFTQQLVLVLVGVALCLIGSSDTSEKAVESDTSEKYVDDDSRRCRGVFGDSGRLYEKDVGFIAVL
jgi:hypothetical protein